MATVLSKTSIKIDDLINGTVVSGAVNESGRLILTTAGGSQIDAGLIGKQYTTTWTSAGSYKAGDAVGYAGMLWVAITDNTNKPPAFYASDWRQIHGLDFKDIVEKDPFFLGSHIGGYGAWEYFWHTGTTACTLTSLPGEFETGTQALKIELATNSSQRLYQREENLCKGGEVITVQVRARLVAASSGTKIYGTLIQNDKTNDPTPLATGAAYTETPSGSHAQLTTSWATYSFALTTVNAKPRVIPGALVYTASESAVVLIDWVRYTRTSAVDKASIGLGNVDNTSDVNKPISTATQAALDTLEADIAAKSISNMRIWTPGSPGSWSARPTLPANVPAWAPSTQDASATAPPNPEVGDVWDRHPDWT